MTMTKKKKKKKDLEQPDLKLCHNQLRAYDYDLEQPEVNTCS